MTAWSLDSRLRRLTLDTAKERGRSDAWQSYEFLVAPSCPPSTAVQIRSGMVLPGFRYGLVQAQTYIPATTCDLGVATDTGLACSFLNAYYYLGVILCYRNAWLANMTASQPYTIVGGASEYATSSAAEQAIELLLNGSSDWFYALFPLRAIVLRNNGITGVDGQVLPIDAVNRGRSYLWWDTRSRNLISK